MMRNLRLLAVLVPVLLAPLAACEDSSSPSAGAFDPDGGPGFEAGAQPDAGPSPVDGGADVTPPAPQGVSVTVTDGKTAQPNVRVIFHDATGAVTSETKTDATGKASIATAPSMVTVLLMVNPEGIEVSNVTFTDVADGDNLVVVGPPPGSSPLVGNYNVTFTGAAVVTGSSSFVTTGGQCASPFYSNAFGDPVQLSIFDDCLMPQNALLATASNGGTVQGFAFLKNVALPAGDVAVGPLAFAAPGTTTQKATGIPVGSQTSALLYAVANGSSFSMDYSTGSIDMAAGVTYSTPTGFAEAYQSAIGIRDSSSGAQLLTEIVRREAVPAAGTALTFDATTVLPLVTTTTLASPTAARPDVTITPAASLATTDGGYASVRWFDDTTQTEGSWVFVVPPTATGFKVPALPADAAAFAPVTTSYIDSVGFVESPALPGYKELKLLPVPATNDPSLLDEGTPLPANGVVRVTRWHRDIP
jgi:hypothetical protein